MTGARGDALRGVAVAGGHAAAAVPWQALARRVGLPFRAPTVREAAGPTLRTLAVAVAATTVLRRLATVVADERPSPRTWGPLAVAGTAPFPVLGSYAAAAADALTARRIARSGLPAASASTSSSTSSSTSVRWTGVRALAAATILTAGREAVYRTLDVALAVRTPAPPPPPRPDLRLNVTPSLNSHRTPAGYVVYLDGVGRAIPRTTPTGREFAEAIQRRLPSWVIVMSLMPNDVTQRPAWTRPVTGQLWRTLMRRSRDWLVARGVWEAIVALDARYRDRMTAEHTSAVLSHLLAAGYRPASGTPIVLVGLSAGAQTALRCASDMARALGGAPVDVVTLGGFADGAADLSGVRRVHAAVSWGDLAELAPVPFLPSRWTALTVGAWSRARRRRQVVVHRHNYATHVGRTGYLGRARAPDGRTRVEQSADLVARAAQELERHRGRRRNAVAGPAPTPRNW